MTHRRLWFSGFAVLLILIAIAFAIVWRPAIDEIREGSAPQVDAAQIARGYELAQLGNCESCHTAENGAAYAGGRKMETPFGAIYAVNITPDRAHGIGAWGPDAFARSMRDGVSRDGTHLYPAFPYTHFTKLTDSDMSALYAYLRSVPAVAESAPENELPFPFNIRALMAGWNLLFLDKDQITPVQGEDDDWNRGRYLVEGLAHCGACHTPRNAVGAEKSAAFLAGAEINGWYAPPLAGAEAGPWNTEQMEAYLANGFSRAHGAAAGPMGETVGNLAQAPRADITAMATYVASLTEGAAEELAAIDNGVPEDMDAAHTLWTGACADCHRNPVRDQGGALNPSYGVPLSTGAAVRSSKPINTLRTIAGGIDAYRDVGGPYMPAFEDSLTSAQIADLARYVRARFSDQAPWEDLQERAQDILGQVDPDENREGDAQ
ncbi:cytochrome C [Pelagivirga sediminicola]|uniref:Cytochrome C n=1 Tax=Pelagivirga sediminicola TaxID=2170575 RepID=A0A2T7G952_9RHOB|nr:c-type cytochrome [Pelagivirga sediminicola]PVA10952.1 cytochrome C [Pelagivirga sediminicola]